jgi:hypothetical protein
VVEHLPSKCGVLSSNSSRRRRRKKKEGRRKKEEGRRKKKEKTTLGRTCFWLIHRSSSCDCRTEVPD